MDAQKRVGRVVTFYAYKGGAGRSMAVANVAALLRKWGRRVLVIDWHLDAPGLEQYLEPEPRSGRKPLAEARRRTFGIADIIEGYAEDRPLAWRDCLLRASVSPRWGQVALLSAGRDDAEYSDKVRSIDWERLIREKDLAGYLAGLRAQWISDFDFVLIDSPTGAGDVGGLCTGLLPDLLIALFASSEHSLSGARQVIERARQTQARLAPDRVPLRIVPIMARDESLTEYERSMGFRAHVADVIGEHCRTWLPPQVPVSEALARLKLPYAAAWSFGERLPVVLEGTSDPASLGYAYQTLARLLDHDLCWDDATDAETKLANAEERGRAAEASLALARKKLRTIITLGGATALLALSIVWVAGLWRAREAHHERLDTLVEAVRSEDDPTKAAILWDEVAAKSPRRSLGETLGAHRGIAWPTRAFRADSNVTALALGPNASSLAWSGSDGVFLRRFATGAGTKESFQILSKQSQSQSTLRISQDGRLLLGTRADRAPALWNLDASTQVELPELPAQVSFWRGGPGLFGIAPDLSSASLWPLPGLPNDATEQPPRRVPIAMLADVSRPFLRALGADGGSFLGEGSSGGRQVLLVGTLRGDRQGEQTLRALAPDCAVQGAAVSEATLAFQCALADSISLHSKFGAHPPIGAPGPGAGDLKRSSFNGDGSLLITTWNQGVSMACEIAGDRCATLREHDPIVQAELSPDGLTAVTLTSTGIVRIWRLGLAAAALDDWASLSEGVRRDVDACLAPADRSLLLGEDAEQARARYQRCERDHGRSPELRTVSTADNLPSLVPSQPGGDGSPLSLATPELPGGMVRVTTGLNMDSESGHVLFPLSLTGTAASSQEGFGVVAGEGTIVTFSNSGVFMQQPLGTTAIVAATGSQFVASKSSLSDRQKTPMPWLVVDSQRVRGGQQWQAARPFLQLVRDFRWDQASGLHVAQFAFGLDAENERTNPLAQPIAVRFATACKVSPNSILLTDAQPSSVQFLTVACSREVKNQRAIQTLGIRVPRGALDYPFAIPRRPGAFELRSSASRVLGLGLGTLELTAVNTEEDRTPLPAASDLLVPLEVHPGRLEPGALTIPAGRAMVTATVRSLGAGPMHVRVGLRGLESSPIAIGRSSPLFFIGVTLFGGGVGGYVAERRARAARKHATQSWRSLVRKALLGAVLGMSLTAAILALFSGPVALHNSELAWFLGSALLGFAGAELAELAWAEVMRRRAARQLSMSEA